MNIKNNKSNLNKGNGDYSMIKKNSATIIDDCDFLVCDYANKHCQDLMYAAHNNKSTLHKFLLRDKNISNISYDEYEHALCFSYILKIDAISIKEIKKDAFIRVEVTCTPTLKIPSIFFGSRAIGDDDIFWLYVEACDDTDFDISKYVNLNYFS